LLYWYKSTCLLVQKYLLTGTKVQILTPEEQGKRWDARAEEALAQRRGGGGGHALGGGRFRD
jgi:hypothetical protein